MSFDNSRFPFNPWNDFSGVVMEQGRVQLDSDWNEWLAELSRRIRAGTLDTLGRAVYPATTPNAFFITPTVGSILIGVGRMYVDGLLAENHGQPAPQSVGWIPPTVKVLSTQPGWDPALDELVGQNPIDYTQQPYFPNAQVVAPFPTSGGPFLIYLDVWTREVTFLEDPDLIEKAVGIDTTGRLQTVWQVRWLDVHNNAVTVTCSTKDSDISPWEPLIQPSAGRLSTGVVQSSPSGPCCLTPNTGYTGLENQFYRVEIHQGTALTGTPGTATFKWSRDNASVATAVSAINGKVLTVQSTGKDKVLGFSTGDWVELTDDFLELNGQAGELHEIDVVDNTAQTITLLTTPGTFNPDDPARHTRLIRWDQKGKVLKSDGTLWVDLEDASAGTPNGAVGIPVPPPGTALILENGVTVSFDLNPTTGCFIVADYWTFAARTVDGTVEYLVEAPPRGIHHHYARLAVLTFSDSVGTASDCRLEWPPPAGTGCDCASCVTADSHNTGTWTIQDAINVVQAAGGGKVCLAPGSYNITSTINVEAGSQGNDPANITISGQGLPTLSPAGVTGSIMLIQGAVDIFVEGIAFAAGSGAPSPTPLAGLTITDSSYVRVEHCLFGLATDSAPFSPAIGLTGAVLYSAFRENLFFNVSMGIALLPGAAPDGYLLTQIEIEDNQMYCLYGAVYLSNSDPALVLVSDIRFAQNFVQGTSGFVLLGSGLDVAVENNTFTIAGATQVQGLPYDAAVVCNCSQTRVANNQISGAAGKLTVTASGDGPLSGTYMWVVTALEPSGREIVVTSYATLENLDSVGVQLEWATVLGVSSYNVYRTVANGTDLKLDAQGLQGSGAIITYTDIVPDGSLANQPPFPQMQNDGIVLGVPDSENTWSQYGWQITGNQIGNLAGTGIVGLATALLMQTIIAQNQLANLDLNAIILNGGSVDVDLIGNMIVNAVQHTHGLTTEGIAVFLVSVIGANISGNHLHNLGSTGFAGIFVNGGSEARIAENRVTDLGGASSVGIHVEADGSVDIIGNEVRRATNPPQLPPASNWLALGIYGGTVNVQRNLLESFGGDGTGPGTVNIAGAQSCLFSNNQCFLDDPNTYLVVAVQASSIIAMGNLVQGLSGGNGSPSMSLIVTTSTFPPLLVVIGNITSSSITTNPGEFIPPEMVPLNVMNAK